MDAKHLLFLLELFEGKLGIDDIFNMELPLLLNLEKEKADQIEKEAKRIANMNKNTGNGKANIVTNGRKR
jgi:hypothetical protein